MRIFGFGKKKKEIVDNSNLEMRELINDIKRNFDIKKLSWDHTNRCKRWTYKLNTSTIKLIDEDGSATDLVLNNEHIYTSLISNSLLNELIDFFSEMEKNEKVLRNTKIFNSVLSIMQDANKYNL